MRRILSAIAVSAAVLAASSADAQAQTLGFKLGAAFSNINVSDGGDSESTDRITGFIGGGHIRFGLAGRLGLQAELLSVTKGADFPNNELRLEYIEVPVLVHVPLTMGMSFAPYVFGGPSIAFEVRCRGTGAGGASVDCDDAGVFDRNSTDFGVTAGGGLAFAMGPGALLVEGRYTWGLSNLDSSDLFTIRNRSAAVMAGYEIPLGRRW